MQGIIKEDSAFLEPSGGFREPGARDNECSAALHTHVSASRSQKMKRYLIVISVIGCVWLVMAISNTRSKPPLRRWDLGTIPKGSDHITLTFMTPKRDCQPSYWSYDLGIVLPTDEDFELNGRLSILSAKRKMTTIIDFDPTLVTKSSWLQDPTRTSYLLRDDFGMRDEEEYRLEIHFDKPLPTDVGVTLHFLSHTNPKQNGSEQAASSNH